MPRDGKFPAFFVLIKRGTLLFGLEKQGERIPRTFRWHLNCLESSHRCFRSVERRSLHFYPARFDNPTVASDRKADSTSLSPTTRENESATMSCVCTGCGCTRRWSYAEPRVQSTRLTLSGRHNKRVSTISATDGRNARRKSVRWKSIDDTSIRGDAAR